MVAHQPELAKSRRFVLPRRGWNGGVALSKRGGEAFSKILFCKGKHVTADQNLRIPIPCQHQIFNGLALSIPRIVKP